MPNFGLLGGIGAGLSAFTDSYRQERSYQEMKAIRAQDQALKERAANAQSVDAFSKLKSASPFGYSDDEMNPVRSFLGMPQFLSQFGNTQPVQSSQPSGDQNTDSVNQPQSAPTPQALKGPSTDASTGLTSAQTVPTQQIKGPNTPASGLVAKPVATQSENLPEFLPLAQGLHPGAKMVEDYNKAGYTYDPQSGGFRKMSGPLAIQRDRDVRKEEGEIAASYSRAGALNRNLNTDATDAGKAILDDKIIVPLTQARNKADRALDVINNKKVPLTADNFSIVASDLAGIISGGVATEGGVDRAKVETFIEKANELQKKFGSLSDLRTTQPQVVKQMTNMLMDLRTNVNSSIINRKKDYGNAFSMSTNPAVKSVVDKIMKQDAGYSYNARSESTISNSERSYLQNVLKSNPKDPRAPQIKALLGVK